MWYIIIGVVVFLYIVGAVSEENEKKKIQIHRFGNKYKLSCNKCKSHKVRLVDEKGVMIRLICDNCGNDQWYELNR